MIHIFGFWIMFNLCTYKLVRKLEFKIFKNIGTYIRMCFDKLPIEMCAWNISQLFFISRKHITEIGPHGE